LKSFATKNLHSPNHGPIINNWSWYYQQETAVPGSSHPGSGSSIEPIQAQYRLSTLLQTNGWIKSSQCNAMMIMGVKSMMLTDAGSDEPLCPYHS